MHLISTAPCSKTKQWRTGLTLLLQHHQFLPPAAKLLNKQLDLLSCRSANLLIAPQLYLKLFSWGSFSLLFDSKMDGLWKEIFVPLFVFKQLGNNAGTTKQIQCSLDFFKMSKTKTIQLTPKAILKILKVLALETTSFSYKAISFYMPSSQNAWCPLSSAQLNLFKALFKPDFLWESHWHQQLFCKQY